MQSTNSKASLARPKRVCVKCHICGRLTKHEGLLHWCAKCQHGMSIHGFDATVYDSAYADEYVKRSSSDFGKDLLHIRVDAARGVLGTTAPISTLLDYGCGTGNFVTAMRKFVSRAYGYDVNTNYLKVWGDRKYLTTSLTRVPLPLDIVTFFDSLEHVKDVRGCLQYLNPKYAIVALPLFTSLKRVKTSKHFKPREHLHYFTHQSITKLFHISGFTLTGADTVESRLGREGIFTFFFERRA